MGKYIVQAPVDNGKRFEIGEDIELSDKDAGPLLAVGAVVAKSKARKADDTDKGDGSSTGGGDGGGGK